MLGSKVTTTEALVKNENFAKLAPKDKAEQKIATSKEMYANYFDSEYAPGAVSAFYC